MMHTPARLFAAAATALALGVAAAPPASAQPAVSDAAFRATTLNLNAYGEVRVTPDQATVTTGVTTEAATAAEAVAANRTQMTRVIDALKKAGIDARDIQTSGLNLNPKYVYAENQPPRLTGYEVSNQVTVVARDLSRLGPTLDAVVSTGANRIGGVTFGLQNPQAAEDEARRRAVKALTDKAGLYAQASGTRVARLVNLTEQSSFQPEPPRPMMMAMAKMERADSTPVEAGELRVRVEVQGQYELTR